MLRLRKTAIMMAILTAIVLGTGPAFANLITNGDFESGNAGFTSAYLYFAQPSSPANHYAYPKASLYDEGTYGVGANPNLYHVNWGNVVDHTTGQGNMMIVNGSRNTFAGLNVWSDTCAVDLNTTYDFSAWMTAIYPNSQSNLAISINGKLIGAIQLAGSPGTWQHFFEPWFSGSDTTAKITLVDLTHVAGGNDFAIDDIGFDKRSPVPIPAAVWLFGSGLLGLFGVRRKIVK
jgi:hypothetical protein